MASFLGLDTSNYTTSVAICASDGTMKQAKKLLPVKSGEIGLRQNDAVFHHVNRLPDVFGEVVNGLSEMPDAVGVSARPRDENGSYMPCFTVGASFGRMIAQLLNVPCYEFSHQAGHIAAGLYSAGRLDLLKRKFLAVHVSGGTTEALLVAPDELNVIKTEIVAKTLDLTAGQLIDRVGVALGLDFPAGGELEKLALCCDEAVKVKPTLKGADCCLSGVENLCASMRLEQQRDEEVARFCIEYVGAMLEAMCKELLRKFSEMPVVFVGGVMSNVIIKRRLSSCCDAILGEPEFSSDNAAGVAVLTAIKAGKL